MTAAAWVDLLDPTVADLDAVLPDDIHDVALERLAATPRHDDEPRPRLEIQGDYLFGILVIPRVGDMSEELRFQEVDVVVSRSLMVTVRKTPADGGPPSTSPASTRRGPSTSRRACASTPSSTRPPSGSCR